MPFVKSEDVTLIRELIRDLLAKKRSRIVFDIEEHTGFEPVVVQMAQDS
jgi:hypothetical protein